MREAFRQLAGVPYLLTEGGTPNELRATRIGRVSLVSSSKSERIQDQLAGDAWLVGAPSIFDSSGQYAGVPAPVTAMTVKDMQMLEGGTVWLRYEIRNG